MYEILQPLRSLISAWCLCKCWCLYVNTHLASKGMSPCSVWVLALPKRKWTRWKKVCLDGGVESGWLRLCWSKVSGSGAPWQKGLLLQLDCWQQSGSTQSVRPSAMYTVTQKSHQTKFSFLIYSISLSLLCLGHLFGYRKENTFFSFVKNIYWGAAQLEPHTRVTWVCFEQGSIFCWTLRPWHANAIDFTWPCHKDPFLNKKDDIIH